METKTKKKFLFKRPVSLKPVRTHYCPGCGHGIVHRLIAEVIDTLGVRERTIGVVPVGCACIAYEYFNFDSTESPHGRTPAVATGIKRSLPNHVVFTYQGDGDLAAIGTAETLHAANRGENITIIFVNNGVYGMTGGQMAPTTLTGQKTTTTPNGRTPKNDGYPLKITEILSSLDGVCYAARGLITSVAEIKKSRQMILKAFQMQLKCAGLSIVELLSSCPTYWRVTPLEAKNWIDKKMVLSFNPGVLKEIK
ncbi:MAG: 2-oxoglutarate oxidoreductase [Candidatus Aureabacteria bacterium]|nr:2-oxoglutarate oxidoreductase [Candidatus Auribacterota bacterium]